MFLAKKYDGCVGKINIRRFVTHVMQSTGMSRSQATPIVMAVFDSIKQLLFERFAIAIPKFGTFYLKKVKGGIFETPKAGQVFLEEHLKPKILFSNTFVHQVRELDKDVNSALKDFGADDKEDDSAYWS